MDRWQIGIGFAILWTTMLLTLYLWVSFSSKIKCDLKGVQPRIEVFGKKYKKKSDIKPLKKIS